MENKKTRGRPPKKDYNPEALMQELIDTAVEIYHTTGEIKATAIELSLPPNKVKKLLITGGAIKYQETEQIQSLQRQGKSMAEIQTSLNLSYSTLHTYLPYTKVIYKMSEISQNAERVKIYKNRKAAVEELEASPTEEHLWNCVVLFQSYPFHTVSGLPFTYTLKTGRNGEYTRELFIDRRENSKSLSWSSVRMVYVKALEKRGTVFSRPKELADVRGVSYTFSLLWRFGLIEVDEETEGRLRGKR